MKSFLGQDLFKKMPFATRPKFLPLPQLATMAMDRGGPITHYQPGKYYNI